MRLNNHAAHLSLSRAQISYQLPLRRPDFTLSPHSYGNSHHKLGILPQPQVIAHLYCENPPWRMRVRPSSNLVLNQPRWITNDSDCIISYSPFRTVLLL